VVTFVNDRWRRCNDICQRCFIHVHDQTTYVSVVVLSVSFMASDTQLQTPRIVVFR
jgi:hypothetical protein